MKIAYLVLCHKSPEQAEILLDSLDCPEASFFIHVDRKSSFSEEAFAKRNNLFFVANEARVDIQWGTFSMVEATLRLLELAKAKDSFDYYVLLSGQDLPLLSAKSMVKFFKEANGTNYVNFFPALNNTGKKTYFDKRTEIVYPAWMMKRGLLNRCFRRAYLILTGGHVKTIPFLKRKLDVKIYHGASWWAFTGEFINWAFSYLSEHPKFKPFFVKAAHPDESFFQTLFMNSPMAEKKEDYLHYVDWEGTKGGSPNTLKLENFDKIFASGKPFARKFDAAVDKAIIEKVSKRAREN